MLKLTQLVLLLLLFSLSASSVPFATPDPKVVSHSPVKRTDVPRDLSGEYKGIVDFGDESGNHKIMSGPATLLIYGNGKEFILTRLRRKKVVKVVKGKISTAILNQMGIGDIQLNNESEIAIRWLLDEANRLMIVPPKNGQNRVFIFCPQDIKPAECAERVLGRRHGTAIYESPRQHRVYSGL